MKWQLPLTAAALAAAAVQVGPAATWLPAVRRALLPDLASPMAPQTIAVTFDDGPHPQGTPAILDQLDELGWRAAFFVLGSATVRHPDLVAEIRRRGHEVGVHGFDHRYLIARTPRAQWDDLHRGVDAVGEAAGGEVSWWRPPYGVLSAASLAAALRLGARPLLWSAWGRDWRADATPGSIVETACGGQLDGGTLLLHDSDVMSSPDSWRRTVAALPGIADRLAAQGVQVRQLPAPA